MLDLFLRRRKEKASIPAADLGSLLDYNDLRERFRALAPAYTKAQPFPSAVIDNVLSPGLVDQLLEVFPTPATQALWTEMVVEGEQYGKQSTQEFFSLAPLARQLFWELQSSTFIRLLEELTGINNLLPDPSMQGGGFHQILRGGKLGVHADFTRHKRYGLYRRVNVLIYLNKDWRDDYEGHLELWSADMSHCVRRLRPLAGRCVVFSTGDTSFHGHPRELQCPPDSTRKSIALYYYTVEESAAGVQATKATNWQNPPAGQLPELE